MFDIILALVKLTRIAIKASLSWNEKGVVLVVSFTSGVYSTYATLLYGTS